MKTFDDFLPYVLTDVPGCAEVVAISALNSAAIEFCEKTLVIQRDHDPVNIVAGRNDYDLDSPVAQMLVCKVMKAWYGTRVLTPTGPDDMDDPTVYNATLQGGQGLPLNYIQREERVITLWPRPTADAAGALTMRVALKPTRAALSVDDVLFEDWVEVIASGAKAMLQAMAAKAFTNPTLAIANQGAFLQGINRAQVRANKGNTRTNLSVRMRRL
jgi:hypothetical protein